MSRRLARETALQVMFQVDISKGDPAATIEYTFEEFAVPESSREFARRLVTGTLDHLAEIDATIQAVAKDWHLERMANVDRNILRLAGFELLYCPDVPGNVAVNEAIELAKIYSGDEAGRFVNGILGVLLTRSGRAKENGGISVPVVAMEEFTGPQPETKTEKADIRPVAEGERE